MGTFENRHSLSYCSRRFPPRISFVRLFVKYVITAGYIITVDIYSRINQNNIVLDITRSYCIFQRYFRTNNIVHCSDAQAAAGSSITMITTNNNNNDWSKTATSKTEIQSRKLCSQESRRRRRRRQWPEKFHGSK